MQTLKEKQSGKSMPLLSKVLSILLILGSIACQETIEPRLSATIELQDFGIVKLFNTSTNVDRLTIDWGDGDQTIITDNSFEVNHQYEKNGTYIIEIANNDRKIFKQAVINNCRGAVSIFTYTKWPEPLEVYIDNQFAGSITKYLTQRVADMQCGQDYGFFKYLEVGRHTLEFRLRRNGVRVNYNPFEITNGKCTFIEAK